MKLPQKKKDKSEIPMVSSSESILLKIFLHNSVVSLSLSKSINFSSLQPKSWHAFCSINKLLDEEWVTVTSLEILKWTEEAGFLEDSTPIGKTQTPTLIAGLK